MFYRSEGSCNIEVRCRFSTWKKWWWFKWKGRKCNLIQDCNNFLLQPVVGATFNWQLHCELVGLATGCCRLCFLVCRLVNRPFHKVSMVCSCNAVLISLYFFLEIPISYHSSLYFLHLCRITLALNSYTQSRSHRAPVLGSAEVPSRLTVEEDRIIISYNL